MKYSNDRNVSDVVRDLVRNGWRYHMSGRHGKLVSPTGRRMPVPCTPSDHRAFLNFKRDVRKLLVGCEA